jgi:hypothetical protein
MNVIPKIVGETNSITGIVALHTTGNL